MAAKRKKRTRVRPSRRRPRRQRWGRVRRGLVGVAVVLLAIAVIVVWRLNRDVSSYLAARESPSLRLYGTPFVLRAGVNVDGARLLARLDRLGYREVSGDGPAPPVPATYRQSATQLEIGVREFVDAAGVHPSTPVRLDLAEGTIVGLTRLDDGAVLDEVSLEPEQLEVYGAIRAAGRRPVRLGDLPPYVVAAFLAAEDVRFTLHPGIDPVGIARAALVNLTEGAIAQGGSTITQQLAKNVFLSAERRWSRKAAEAVLALILELRLSKGDILETYMGTVYFGRIGSIGLYGIRQAARAYFGREPEDLSVGAAATIAGILRGPNAYSPLRHPERARGRRDRVLGAMRDEGWIDEATLAAARDEPIASADAGRLEGAYFVDEVQRRLATFGYAGVTARGLTVFTTLDVEMQRQAERAVRTELEALVERRPALAKDGPVEAAVVVLEAATGAVRALTGGRDFAVSQFNRATRARRQPGSAFKPFVYLAALADPERPLTAASPLQDTPIRERAGGQLWTPANYDGRFVGPVTMRRALVESRNIPAVRVAQHVGLERVAALADDVGLGPMAPLPAMALGAEEVSLLRLVGAYSVFPNLGEVVEPVLIRGVLAADGTVLFRDQVASRRVAPAAASYVASRLLEAVVDEGTGRGVRRRGMRRPVAGKTGTTNDERDAWYVGYTPELVAGVWVGIDDGTPLGLTGGAAALPIWVALMRPASATFEARAFREPPGVVYRTVDRNLEARWGRCRTPVREAFVAGTEPATDCDALRFARRDRAPSTERAPSRPEGPAKVVRQVGRFFRRLFGGD